MKPLPRPLNILPKSLLATWGRLGMGTKCAIEIIAGVALTISIGSIAARFFSASPDMVDIIEVGAAALSFVAILSYFSALPFSRENETAIESSDSNLPT